jgi:hypothetical protein
VTVEIDLLEYYGKFPDGFHSVVHLWGANHPGSDHIKFVPTGSLEDDFHTYGFEVE